MAHFFRNPADLASWVKELGFQKAAHILVNLPKVGQGNAYDIMETAKRIVQANDSNASEVLFGILTNSGITESDVKKTEDNIEQVRAANELLANKVIAKHQHAELIKEATYLRDPAVYDMPLRICPKLPWSVGKKLISTYNCRHYCLDSIVLDDDPTRIYCGELLWRRHVADKFSSDQQDRKTGELYGGYVNERFYKFPDAGTPSNPDVPRNGGHPMELKPGERTRVPRPEQWSVERRMQEAREKGSTTDHVLGKTASADSSWFGKMVEANAVEVKEEPTVKNSEDDTARKVIMATGNDNFIKLSSNAINSANIDDNILQAFSLAVDLKNDGFSDTEAVIKVAEATGIKLAKAASIQAVALKKLENHVSDAYVMDFDENQDPSQTDESQPDDNELQQGAEEVGLLDE